MNFQLYIARRYIFSKSKNNAINIINGIASLGIVVGTMALFIVLSVFSGLREFSLTFSSDFDPDLKVNSIAGKSFYISPSQENELKKIDGILNLSKIVEERVLFSFDGKQQVTYLKGVDKNFTNINAINTKLYNGQWFKADTYQAVVGFGISQKLSIGVFDFNHQLEVYVPKPGKGQIESENAFNKEFLIPVGIYAINDDLDSKYVFVDLGLAQQLMGFQGNQVSGIEIKTKSHANQEKIILEIEKLFKNKVDVKTRAQLNSTLYKMLNTENIAVYLIFTLVIMIALFNLIGALIMMILEKKENLKTLFNLGAEIKDLRKIFLLEGTLLSIFGGILGLFLGIILVLLQQQFNFIMITDTLAYPVVFNIQNVVIVMTTITLLGFIASLIASSRVSKSLLIT